MPVHLEKENFTFHAVAGILLGHGARNPEEPKFLIPMTATELLTQLGYESSPHFISDAEHENLPDGEFAFALRRLVAAGGGAGDGGRFHGSYVLQNEPGGPAVPVVYVIEVPSDTLARRVHTVVWNQNLAPFIIVVSPEKVRLYPGFAYESGSDATLGEVAAESAAALKLLAAFHATSIDDGTVWREWGHAVDPARRSDESLLRDLKELDRILQDELDVPRGAAHGLIGKYVYLSYLRHRDILSPRKLSEWEINPDHLFTRNATLKAFRAVNEKLQEWLNGSVFRIGDEDLAAITADKLKLVAATFAGDSPGGQLHLSFAAYDFAHIPIETLSCVYEQFLHDTAGTGPSRGEELAAYYTPIPLADYMIGEMERQHPLRPGTKVLDPACGSGVFLVQCYRRLIEKERRTKKRELKKTELRDLLTGSIYGIDRDDDACRVTELSLILTLLDYVTPPDLEDTNFKLPSLRGQNIFKDDFFRTDGDWAKTHGDTRFDWCIGNPPWKEVKGAPAKDHPHFPVATWMTENETEKPTGGHKIAEAFLWKAATHLADGGISGLLVPAMTWFKKESVAFRKQFFTTHRVWCLANFANLAYVLFGGRAEVPAAAIFYRSELPQAEDTILTLSPFVAEQVANRPQEKKGPSKRGAKRNKGDLKKGTTWNIIVSDADMRDVPLAEAQQGVGLTWKLAMWGTERDRRIISRLQKKFPSFEAWGESNGVIAHQGVELREASDAEKEPLEEHRELIGKLRLSFSNLRNVEHIAAFPPGAYSKIEEHECFVRRGRSRPLSICNPPHIAVDAGRRFAVFLSRFTTIPHPHVGIAGASSDELRILTLFLNSDFSVFHQFMCSPQWGVEMTRADLEPLKQLPIPLDALSEQDTKEWLELHAELTALSEKRFSVLGWSHFDEHHFDKLLADVNTRVFRLLRLKDEERWMVEDFVRVNLELNKGKVTDDAMRPPTDTEIALYLRTLRNSLDDHLDDSQRLRHKVDALFAKDGAFFSVSGRRTTEKIAPTISTDANAAATLRQMRDSLRQQHSQWVYFDRGLKRYEPKNGIIYQFKPMHRLHWTRRQAVLDAAELIAESISGSNA